MRTIKPVGFIVGLFLFLTSSATAERAVLVVPGFGGSFSQDLFCNDLNAIDDFQFLLRTVPGVGDNIPQDSVDRNLRS